LDVLELLAERGELRAADLVEGLGISRPTLYRTLGALERRGYVARVPDARAFRLGPAALRLAGSAQRNLLAPLARAALIRLREETGETANFAVRVGHRLVYAEILHSGYSLRPAAAVGDDVAPHATAVGKAVLACLGPEERSSLLGGEPFERFTGETITSGAALDAELERTRRRGYAVDLGETEVGATCVAASVVAPDGTPLGALSVAGATARMHEAVSVVGALVRELAERVSQDYKHRLKDNGAAGPAATSEKEEEP
jgi:IclR family acetate operon transcriptional repressor